MNTSLRYYLVNKDGSETAFVKGVELLVVEVDRAVRGGADQPAIVTVKESVRGTQ